MLKPGQPYPEFELATHDGGTTSSAELQGSTYLMFFYPKADTPGCTKEVCSLRNAWTDLHSAGLQVFGVSFDKPGSNHAFAEKYKLPFPLLSDADKKLAKAVGAKMPLIPLPKRISYLIGADGVILKAYPSVNPKNHAAEVLEDARALGVA